MITLPFASMSVGAPKAAVSTEAMSVSNVTPNELYSASVKPPEGFVVSATMIAFCVIAATRPNLGVGDEHAVRLVLRETMSPMLGGAAAALRSSAFDERRVFHHARAAGAYAAANSRSRV